MFLYIFFFTFFHFKGLEGEVLKKSVTEIFKKFIEGTSESYVNLPGKIVNEIQNNLGLIYLVLLILFIFLFCKNQKTENPTCEIFNEARKHIHKLMKADPYIRFLNSPFFEKLVKEVKFIFYLLLF